MKYLLAIALAFSLAGIAQAQPQFGAGPQPASPDGPESLFGAWGTDAQCRAHQSGAETNPARLPCVIGNQWMRQSFIYCHLTWRGHELSNGMTQAWADARCGEDDVRDYRLQLSLETQLLSIRWSEDFVSRGLRICHS